MIQQNTKVLISLRSMANNLRLCFALLCLNSFSHRDDEIKRFQQIIKFTIGSVLLRLSIYGVPKLNYGIYLIQTYDPLGAHQIANYSICYNKYRN